jgi:hypothetical protein
MNKGLVLAAVALLVGQTTAQLGLLTNSVLGQIPIQVPTQQLAGVQGIAGPIGPVGGIGIGPYGGIPPPLGLGLGLLGGFGGYGGFGPGFGPGLGYGGFGPGLGPGFGPGLGYGGFGGGFGGPIVPPPPLQGQVQAQVFQTRDGESVKVDDEEYDEEHDKEHDKEHEKELDEENDKEHDEEYNKWTDYKWIKKVLEDLEKDLGIKYDVEKDQFYDKDGKTVDEDHVINLIEELYE